MKIYTYIIIALLCLPAFSCRQRSFVESQLSKAQACVQEFPDSALHIVRQIDRNQIASRRLRAEYALLYSMALDKNNLFVEDDSLIRIARDYYRHGRDAASKFLSSFYYGRVLCNRAEHKRALVVFLGIEEEGLALGNSYWLGLLYHEISAIYGSQYDFVNALKYAQLSYDHYARADKRLHICYALCDVGDLYYNLEQYDSAETYYARSLKLSRQICDTPVMRIAISNMSLAHIEQQRPLDAIAALWSIVNELHEELDKYEIVSMAISQQKAGRTDSARYYLDRAEPLFEACDPASVSYWKNAAAIIHMKTGEWKKAAHEIRYYASMQDSMCRIALKQSYASAHRDFLYQRERAAHRRLQMVRRNTRLTVSLCMVVIVLIGFVAYGNYRKRQLVKAQYMAAVDEMKSANRLLLAQLDAHKKKEAEELSRIIKDRYAVVSELATTYYEHKAINEQRAIFDKVKSLFAFYSSDVESRKEIEQVVNMCYDNVMQRVREELPALKEAEYNLLCFVYAGFSLRVISVFTGDSINYTAVKKSRLKAKIANSDAKSKEWFVRLMK